MCNKLSHFPCRWQIRWREMGWWLTQKSLHQYPYILLILELKLLQVEAEGRLFLKALGKGSNMEGARYFHVKKTPQCWTVSWKNFRVTKNAQISLGCHWDRYRRETLMGGISIFWIRRKRGSPESWILSLYELMLMVSKWIFKSSCPVKHQGINACVHGMKLYLISAQAWTLYVLVKSRECHSSAQKDYAMDTVA